MTVVNFEKLAEQIAEPPPKYSDAMPDYLEHQYGVPRAAALSAAAIGKSYEEAAQAIEAMGAALKPNVEACERYIAEANDAIQYCKELAEQYRKVGAERFKQIEENGKATDDVKVTCAALKEKILGV